MFQHLRLERALVLLDLETTGTRPAHDRIVEIALWRVAPGERPRRWVQRLNPGVPIPAAASTVHQITDADVANCPPFRAVASRLDSILQGADLAGFNIRRFDLPFLIAEFQRAGITFRLASRKVVDVLQLYHQNEPRDLSAALRFYCGREHPGAHQADADVRATASILEAMLARYSHLPQTMAGLHAQMTDIDIGGWFRQGSQGIEFAIGKYTGRRLSEIALEAPDYLQWMLSQPLLDDARTFVQAALARAGAEPA